MDGEMDGARLCVGVGVCVCSGEAGGERGVCVVCVVCGGVSCFYVAIRWMDGWMDGWMAAVAICVIRC